MTIACQRCGSWHALGDNCDCPSMRTLTIECYMCRATSGISYHNGVPMCTPCKKAHL